MIEPYISDKQCSKCGQCKPVTEFSTKGEGRYGPCRECKQRQERARYRTRRSAAVRNGKVELYPRTLTEAVLDRSARDWRYPVERATLKAAA